MADNVYEALSAADLAELTRQTLVQVEQKIHGLDIDILMNEEVARRKQDAGEGRQIRDAIARVRKERASLVLGLAALREHHATEKAAAETLDAGDDADGNTTDTGQEPIKYPTLAERRAHATGDGA